MIDIHCHILPGLDDCAADTDEALLMARLAYRSGTTTLLATPHVNASHPIPPSVIHSSTAQLRSRLDAIGLALTLLPGAEVLCTRHLAHLLDDGCFVTLAGSRYLLVEFPFHEEAAYMHDMLRTVTQHGLVPVIAHPERYRAVQHFPQLAAQWFDRGYALQLNAQSLTGEHGREAHRAAMYLVHNGLAHAVAADGHSIEGRLPQLHRAQRVLEERFGPACAQALLCDGPERIVRDAPLF